MVLNQSFIQTIDWPTFLNQSFFKTVFPVCLLHVFIFLFIFFPYILGTDIERLFIGMICFVQVMTHFYPFYFVLIMQNTERRERGALISLNGGLITTAASSLNAI